MMTNMDPLCTLHAPVTHLAHTICTIFTCLIVILENKAIHDPDRPQLLLDLIVKVVTVAEAATAASALQKGVCFL